MLTLLAHAAPITYKFPLPIWLYVGAGGIAVLVSAPVAALAVSEASRPERRGRDLYRVLSRLRIGPTVTALGFAVTVVAFAGGLFSTTVQATEFFENPMTLLTWVDFWVGLGITAWVLGNFYERVAPLNVVARVLDRALARREIQPLAYPAWLGQWPATGLLLIWSWMELIWGAAKDPRTLGLILVAYILASLTGTVVFGAETWFGNVELFSVLARTFSRFSPLELRPFVPEQWAAAALSERSARLRLYGAGLRTDPPLPVGGGSFVIAALATVVFDGWSQTDRFGSLQLWLVQRWTFLNTHTDVLQTLSMGAVIAAFIAAYLLVARAQSRLLATTLIPIAAVYFTAHYLAYLLIAGQATLGVIVDPFGHSWNPLGWGEYGLWKGIAPAAAIWWIQILLIVGGHVAAIFAAHRLALRSSTRANALLRQLPVVALMVAYTVAGLWVLAQQIKA